MLTHALEHASQKAEFDNMIAVLGLDNTIEYILRTITSHLDLESLTGRSFDIFDLSSLSAEINKSLKELAGVHLPYLGDIKLLRQTRNLVQHGAVAPYADLKRFSTITERFFNKVLQSIFGFSIEELRVSKVVENPDVSKFLSEAEAYLDSKSWLEAIVASRNAFENEYFQRVKHLNISLSLYPSLVLAKEQNEVPSYGLDTIREELELSYLGINHPEYRRFNEYVRHIPREYCAEDLCGRPLMQRPWERDDAIFCYNYVAGTILRWQSREKERLYTTKLDKDYVFNETIAGINITRKAEGGCSYYYDNNQRFYLFYASKGIKKRFEKIQKNKLYKYKTIEYIDGKKESVREELIRLLGRHIFSV